MIALLVPLLYLGKKVCICVLSKQGNQRYLQKLKVSDSFKRKGFSGKRFFHWEDFGWESLPTSQVKVSWNRKVSIVLLILASILKYPPPFSLEAVLERLWWALTRGVSAHGFNKVYGHCYRRGSVVSWAHWTERGRNQCRAKPLASLLRLSAALQLLWDYALVTGGRPVLCQRSPSFICPVRGARKIFWSCPATHDYPTFQYIWQLSRSDCKREQRRERACGFPTLLGQGMLTWSKHFVSCLHTLTCFASL